MIRNVIWFISLLAGGYLLLLGLMYMLQEQMIFLPDGTLTATPADIGMPYEQVHLESEDGIRLHGWLVEADGPARGTLLFFHGNAGNISHRLESLQQFHRLGMDVLIIDYRGYGNSEGSPDEKGTYKDAEAAWQWLTRDRGVPPGEIVLFGRSLGASVAAWLAMQTEPAGLIMESAFTSAADLGQSIYPIFPVHMLLRVRYPTLDYLQQTDAPVLVAHSPDDEIVPYEMGRTLYENAPVQRQFLELSGGHNDGFLVTGQRYMDGMQEFFNRVLP